MNQNTSKLNEIFEELKKQKKSDIELDPNDNNLLISSIHDLFFQEDVKEETKKTTKKK